jgi:hypothetical protein
MSVRSTTPDGSEAAGDVPGEGLSVTVPVREWAEYRQLRTAADEATAAVRALTDEWRAKSVRLLGGSGKHGTVRLVLSRGGEQVGAFVSAAVVRLRTAHEVEASLPRDLWALVHTVRTQGKLTIEQPTS